MGWLEWFKLVFGTDQFNAHINAMKAINEEYKYKIEQQEKIIKELESERGKPMDDQALEIQFEREREAHMQLIQCLSEKRDIQEELIFLKIELKRLIEKK
jgi:hypothetical protein